ncbi:hypothetical protein LSH36_870g00010 [Paralvinella palmiformis]|uniref:Kinesin-like protein 6 n=1 Tax=Paralvinella palmiformis TaxID=53620 RepID=A0AAD9IZE9_9ANNE|nr:hypothetical protein LSH36_870g00010 [Paralvinella palmiformis]
MSEENVKVAVRVRPFNKRERNRNSTLIVEMKNSTTYLTDPENPNEKPRSFAFDYSYWSHDGSKEESNGYFGPDMKHPNGKIFCDQKTVYDDLGRGVLANAWEGFNSTLFAYGQTGSGKSWSVVGYGINKGIVPQYCEDMFNGIDKKKAEGDATEYEVLFSMLEIYMEEVRDLLDNKQKKRGGLRVRQHPKKGFYVEHLKVVPVDSYKAIEAKMEQGTTNRTVASTNMNATSSRAHTIVGISFVQKFKNAAGEETTKSASVNLVDLAGSERAESTGATGDRLKEGAAINQSLSSLGNVIAALADRSQGKKVRVPYRDSVLTMLLKNALGGNSRTIMIAAISPADINYDETLSTLRYADRAKQIKTKAVVNEDPTEKLIRELQEENEKLKKMLESGGVVLEKGEGEDGIEETEGLSESEKEELRKQLEEEYKAELEENAREMEEMKKAFEEKLKAAHDDDDDGMMPNISEMTERKKKEPHIYNLNFDPQLTGKIVHFISGEQVTIGTNKGDPSDIVLMGPSIVEKHAAIMQENGKYFVEKLTDRAKILVNGEPVTEKTELGHNDRLMFGTTQLYVFCNPKQRDSSKEKFPDVTFESAQEEITSHSGFDLNNENKSRDEMLLQEDMVDIMPAIEEANSISEDLDKKKKFEVMLVSPEARGQMKGRTEIYVKMVDLETDHEWVWTREKFLNRKYIMQELFQKFEDGEDISNIPPERDPFQEDFDAECHIGSVKVWLQSLAYMIELKEQLEITDFKGEEVGLLNVECVPCDKKGKEFTEKDDVWLENPQDIEGKSLHFVVKIVSARGLPNRYTDVYAKYVVFMDDEYTSTKVIKDTSNPDWNHKKQFDFDDVTSELLNYLQTGAIMVQIWGKQKPPKTKKNINTRDIMQKATMIKRKIMNSIKMVDAKKVKVTMELAVARKRAEKAEQKVHHFRELVRLAEQYEKPRISTKLIKDLLSAPTQDIAEKCLKMIPKEKGAEDEGPENSPPKTAGDQPAGQTADNEESKQKGVDTNGKPEASETENRPKSSGKRSQTPVNSYDSDDKKASFTCVLL